MRYAQSESTYILSVFNPGDSVTIDIFKLSDGSLVVDDAACTEVGSTGVFKYLFTQAVTQKEEFLWAMTNGSVTRYGKIVLGGWMDTIPANVNQKLSEAHGDGSWEGTTPEAIDALLTEKHGKGSWKGGGGGGSPWYPQDKEEALRTLEELREKNDQQLELLQQLQTLVQALQKSLEARTSALSSVITRFKESIPSLRQVEALLEPLRRPVDLDQLPEVLEKLDTLEQMVVRLLRDEDIDELINNS